MTEANADQQSFWNDNAGAIWVAQMDAMDTALARILEAVLQRAAIRPGERILDIGCGAGTSTIAAAAQAGPTGHALGVDISQTLLSAATNRITPGSNVAFALADAQTFEFEPETFDCLISRFGVMFFADPVAAFANLARGLVPGGRMVLATWGAIPQNPYFTMPAAIAKGVLGPVPKTDPDAPGPFAFRDVDRVRGILSAAGMTDIAAQEVQIDMTPDGDRRAVAELLCEIGPARRALTYFEADAQAQERMIAALEDGLEPYISQDGIRIPTLINLYTARKPA